MTISGAEAEAGGKALWVNLFLNKERGKSLCNRNIRFGLKCQIK